jgi:hypothetical protein
MDLKKITEYKPYTLNVKSYYIFYIINLLFEGSNIRCWICRKDHLKLYEDITFLCNVAFQHGVVHATIENELKNK